MEIENIYLTDGEKSPSQTIAQLVNDSSSVGHFATLHIGWK